MFKVIDSKKYSYLKKSDNVAIHPIRMPYVCVWFAEAVQEPFRDADLLPTLQKMLDDPIVAVEVKFSALGLICSLANSGQYLQTLWKED